MVEANSGHELGKKEHKQRLIDIFVNAVYLYDDKLVIAFNYKEATKTVSLKEVNGSIIECAGVPTKNEEMASAISSFLLQKGLSYIRLRRVILGMPVIAAFPQKSKFFSLC